MLDLNFGLMLIEAGIFLITLVLLNRWLFQPLVKFMDDRERKLEQALSQIEGNTDEVARLEREIEEILHKARLEAKEIIAKARAEAEQEGERIKTKRLAQIEEAKEQFRREIEREKEKILGTLRREEESLKQLLQSKFKGIA